MDKVAFTHAVERYQDMVYRTALHSLGSPHDADDAAQEVFLRLYRREEPFQSEEHLRRWLLRVSVNYCRDVLKSPWRRMSPLSDADADAAPGPEFREERQGALYRAVMALPEKYRTVLYLFYYEELSTGEIAGLLHIQVSAVTTRLSRARGRLKKQLGEDWQDE